MFRKLWLRGAKGFRKGLYGSTMGGVLSTDLICFKPHQMQPPELGTPHVGCNSSSGSMRVVVKIMVPSLVSIITRQLIFGVPKKGPQF